MAVCRTTALRRSPATADVGTLRPGAAMRYHTGIAEGGALVLSMRPDLKPSDVLALRDPPTLNRGAGTHAVRAWGERVRRALAAAQIARASECVLLAHSDSDGPDDGSFEAVRTAELASAGLAGAVAVVPVQAIESWWLRHPDQTESVVAAWKGTLDRKAFSTDAVKDPKSVLVHRTKARSPRRPYRESDSPDIAAAIGAAYPVAAKPQSASFDRFARVVEQLR